MPKQVPATAISKQTIMIITTGALPAAIAAPKSLTATAVAFAASTTVLPTAFAVFAVACAVFLAAFSAFFACFAVSTDF